MRFLSIAAAVSMAALAGWVSANPSRPHHHGPPGYPSHPSHPKPLVPASGQPQFTILELYDMTKNFFDHFMYPLNVEEAKKINSTLYAEDVLGRIDVTRDFNGRELNTEYGFGLFANIALNPKAFTLLGIPQDYKITHWSGNQNIVAVTLLIDFNITALEVISPVEVDMWMTFDKDKALKQYDATFRYLAWQFDWLFELGMKKFQVTSKKDFQDLTTHKLADSICNTAMENCKDDNKQYDSKDECMKFLTKEIRFGQAHELGMNTLLCRMVHQNMVPFRPDVHCSHIGRSGGGYCDDDRSYPEHMRKPFFYHSSMVPFDLNKMETE
ncbi:MAG: hypothetical protein M1831_003954 [Alyxoria varia]|nr:MAG: hypothetical protein M1831_003954 [Alyxoria varia]